MIFIYARNEKGKRQFKPFEEYFYENNIEFKYINSINEIRNELINTKEISLKENSKLIIGQVDDFLIVYLLLGRLKKHINIFYRARGIIPEESYIRNKSKIRYYILSKLEKITIKKCKHILAVTKKQKLHFINKYNIDEDKISVIHNYVSKKKYNIFENGKYRKIKEIVYLGSLSKWQSFDEISNIFKYISEKDNKIKFLICVDKNDICKAQSILNEKKVSNFEIINLPYDELINRISLSTAGIILRNDNIVNRVSSPFKIIDYIQANIPIILSDNIGDYEEMFNNKSFICNIEFSSEEILNTSQKIIQFINRVDENMDYIKNEIYSFAINNLDIDQEIEESLAK